MYILYNNTLKLLKLDMKIKINWEVKIIILLNERGIATDIIFVQLLFWEIPLITRFNPKDHTYMNQNCFMSILIRGQL